MPKWTLQGIADRVGLSRTLVSKIKTVDEDVGIESVKRILETDFES